MLLQDPAMSRALAAVVNSKEFQDLHWSKQMEFRGLVLKAKSLDDLPEEYAQLVKMAHEAHDALTKEES